VSIYQIGSDLEIHGKTWKYPENPGMYPEKPGMYPENLGIDPEKHEKNWKPPE
jgi:hypothetical protein